MTFESITNNFNSVSNEWANNVALFSDAVADYIKSDWLTTYNITPRCLSHNLRELPYFVFTAVVISQMVNAVFQLITYGSSASNPFLSIAILLSLRLILGKSFSPVAPSVEEENTLEKSKLEAFLSTIFGNFVTNQGEVIEWRSLHKNIIQLFH